MSSECTYYGSLYIRQDKLEIWWTVPNKQARELHRGIRWNETDMHKSTS